MDKLIQRIQQIHVDCHILCEQTLNEHLQVAGNIGIFCQNDEEYNEFSKLKNLITKAYSNPNQKYFEIINPIRVEKNNAIPEAIYTYLYIRKPDSTAHGKYLGDIDFIMEVSSYEKLKRDVSENKFPENVTIYDRPNWDTIEITHQNISSVAYISTKEFAEKVRIKFD